MQQSLRKSDAQTALPRKKGQPPSESIDLTAEHDSSTPTSDDHPIDIQTGSVFDCTVRSVGFPNLDASGSVKFSDVEYASLEIGVEMTPGTFKKAWRAQLTFRDGPTIIVIAKVGLIF